MKKKILGILAGIFAYYAGISCFRYIFNINMLDFGIDKLLGENTYETIEEVFEQIIGCGMAAVFWMMGACKYVSGSKTTSLWLAWICAGVQALLLVGTYISFDIFDWLFFFRIICHCAVVIYMKYDYSKD